MSALFTPSALPVTSEASRRRHVKNRKASRLVYFFCALPWAAGCFLSPTPAVASEKDSAKKKTLHVSLLYRDVDLKFHKERPASDMLLVTPRETSLEAYLKEIPPINRLSGKVNLEVEIPSSGEFQLQVKSEDFFSVSGIVSIHQEDEALFEMLPAGWITGTLTLDNHLKWNEKALELVLFEPPRLLSANAEEDRRSFKAHCPVEADRQFRCQVPAGAFEARFSAASWCPIPIWGIEIGVEETVVVGDLKMRRCSTLEGIVEVASNEEQPDFIELSLEPEMPIGRADLALFRATHGDDLELLSYSTSIRPEEESFKIPGVRPGSYRIQAQAEGWAPAEKSPVVISPGKDVALSEALTLKPLGALELFIDPPTLPGGARWMVRIYDSEHRSEMRFSAADESGFWQGKNLLPGEYQLRIESVVGPQSIPSGWHFESIDIRPGAQIVEIEVPIVEVRGQVLKAANPVAATVHFGGRHRPLSIALRSGSDGFIKGILPRGGTWPIEIDLQGNRVLTVEDLELADSEDGEPIEFEIEIPDTALKGIVKNSSGEPVPRAEITVISEGRSRRIAGTRSNHAGEFEIQGLPTETIRIQGKHPKGASRWETIKIEDAVVQETELYIIESETQNAVLLRDGVGLAGAWVQYSLPSNGPASLRTAVSAGDGSFELQVPEGSVVDLAILAPFQGLILRRITFQDPKSQETFEIELDHSPGELILEPPDLSDFILKRGDVAIALPYLLARLPKSTDSSHEVRISAEAGEYSLCRRSRPDNVAQPNCLSFHLNAGGETRLDLRTQEQR